MTYQPPRNYNRTDPPTFKTAEPLSDEFLNKLVSELDNDEVVGIIFGGSYVRNEATPFSDVDIACFVPDSLKPPPKRFMYRDGHLVSIGAKTVAGVRNELEKPERAIFIVAGLRRVLLDKNGLVSKLMREIDTFKWEPLQKAANNYASFGMMISAELVHKILSEFFRCDDLALSYATAKLFSWLTEAVAVQRGVLVKNDSSYYRQIEEFVGLDSAWTRCHRLAAGVETGSAVEMPVRARGVATLELYRETFKLLLPVMYSDHVEVVEQAVRVIDAADALTSSQ